MLSAEGAYEVSIDPRGLRGFRPERRKSNDPDSTEGRETEHALAERDARRSLASARRISLRKTDE